MPVRHAHTAISPLLPTVSLRWTALKRYAGPKQIAVYEFNGHNGGGTRHLRAKLDFLAATLSGT